jgi:hypothetical protein
MQSFIHRKNLELFRKKLAETSDASERREVEKLLAEEEAKETPAAKPRGDR